MSDYGSNPNPDMNVVEVLAHSYNFLPLDKANAMQWDSATATLDIKLAHKQTHSNVHILVDTTEI